MATYAERVTKLINKLSDLQPKLGPQATNFIRGCSRLEPDLISLAHMEDRATTEMGLIGLAQAISNIHSPYEAYEALERLGHSTIHLRDSEYVATNPPELVNSLPWGGKIHLGPHHYGPIGATFTGIDQTFSIQSNTKGVFINGIKITLANLKPME